MLIPTAPDFLYWRDFCARDAGDSLDRLYRRWLDAFETVCDGACKVRMQRIGHDLLVEDKTGGNGAGVSFAGLYHHR